MVLAHSLGIARPHMQHPGTGAPIVDQAFDPTPLSSFSTFHPLVRTEPVLREAALENQVRMAKKFINMIRKIMKG